MRYVRSRLPFFRLGVPTQSSETSLSRIASAVSVVAHYDWSAVAGELENALVRFASHGAADAVPFKTPISTVGVSS